MIVYGGMFVQQSVCVCVWGGATDRVVETKKKISEMFYFRDDPGHKCHSNTVIWVYQSCSHTCLPSPNVSTLSVGYTVFELSGSNRQE